MPSRRVTASKLPAETVRTKTPSGRPSKRPKRSPDRRAGIELAALEPHHGHLDAPPLERRGEHAGVPVARGAEKHDATARACPPGPGASGERSIEKVRRNRAGAERGARIERRDRDPRPG